MNTFVFIKNVYSRLCNLFVSIFYLAVFKSDFLGRTLAHLSGNRFQTPKCLFYLSPASYEMPQFNIDLVEGDDNLGFLFAQIQRGV